MFPAHCHAHLSSQLNMDSKKTTPPSKLGFNRGSWTAAEDKILLDYVAAHGVGKWGKVPKTTGLNRCSRSCRLRWLNYLRPDIKRGNISEDEEDLIVRLHNLLGNRCSSCVHTCLTELSTPLINEHGSCTGKERIEAVLINEDEILDASSSLSVGDRDVFEQLASFETDGLWPRSIFDFEFFFEQDAGVWGGDDSLASVVWW
ncbi:hypothetical protein ZIOFF_049418 [Zingiber officinale]|uniref:Uncharacterized protein n=1 Tax=Zingiber officinale TaxID=94328 RepID=A0A8J5FSV0_ZINOF|nr:hypothetical protein ZIOFF_049418 [Zingiber officinale]